MDRTTSWNDEAARAIIEAGSRAATDFLGTDRVGATSLLPILHALQEKFGYVDRAAIPTIADVLNISKAEVHGTISFYHDFRSEPAGRHVLHLCRAESCQAMGSERLAAYLDDRHKLQPGVTSFDGTLTLENVYCVGNCALSPTALLDGVPVGRLDETMLDDLIAAARGDRP